MSWIPPWLGNAYSTLFAIDGSAALSIDTASRALGFSPRRARLILSLLAREGWLIRVGRGRYVVPEPEAVVALEAAGFPRRYGQESFYPVLVLGLSGVFRTFRSRLRSVALFGSSARREHGAQSDVDLLVVLERVPPQWDERQADLAAVEQAARELNRFLWEERHEYHPVQVTLIDPDGLGREPRLLLDLTEDARILWDPTGVLAGVLERLRGRLRERGSRRVRLEGGRSYWDLTPAGGSGPIEAL
jgi:predicted nucleotidyltransferase